MQLYDQIRTPTGRYPTRDVHLSKDHAAIEFDFYSPQEFAALTDAAKANDSITDILPELSIEDLAVLPQPAISDEGLPTLAIDEADFLDLARQSGPLFGQAESEYEEDWQNAVMMACEVVSMQEVLDEIKNLGASKMAVDKYCVASQTAGNEFSIYVTSFDLGSTQRTAYRKSMPEFPWFKRFSQEGVFDYSFMQTTVEDEHIILTAYLLSFAQEISLVDFAAVIAYFYDDPTIIEAAVRAVADEQQDTVEGVTDEQAIESALGIASQEKNLTVKEATLDKKDYPHLQRLLNALVSLYLQGIRVDVFSSSKSDDFMVFDSYLSYLWYKLANKRGQVKIGYCERCGKGFSLTKQRGITKRFCSEKCKTEEKNERMRNLTKEERRRFWEGESVRAIAQAAAHEKQELKRAMDSVRKNLRKWKQLQHALDAALVTGPEAVGFIKRCANDEIFNEDYVRNRALRVHEDSRTRKAARNYADDPEFVAVITRKYGDD